MTASPRAFCFSFTVFSSNLSILTSKEVETSFQKTEINNTRMTMVCNIYLQSQQVAKLINAVLICPSCVDGAIDCLMRV